MVCRARVWEEGQGGAVDGEEGAAKEQKAGECEFQSKGGGDTCLTDMVLEEAVAVEVGDTDSEEGWVLDLEAPLPHGPTLEGGEADCPGAGILGHLRLQPTGRFQGRPESRS